MSDGAGSRTYRQSGGKRLAQAVTVNKHMHVATMRQVNEKNKANSNPERTNASEAIVERSSIKHK
eukprot:6181342-Pleurochrysis_carterae.AAC.4